MKSGFWKNEGFIFIVKFLGLFIILYYFNLFFISITFRRSNAFYMFLKLHLDYIDGLRFSILRVSEFICGIIGVKCHMESDFIIRLDSKLGGLKMVYRCIGYGVMSFWAAFVLANKARIINKIVWIVFGWLIIWIINCIRVIMLLSVLQHQWPISTFLDHHTLFNILSYILIFVLIYAFIKQEKDKKKLKIEN